MVVVFLFRGARLTRANVHESRVDIRIATGHLQRHHRLQPAGLRREFVVLRDLVHRRFPGHLSDFGGHFARAFEGLQVVLLNVGVMISASVKAIVFFASYFRKQTRSHLERIGDGVRLRGRVSSTDCQRPLGASRQTGNASA